VAIFGSGPIGLVTMMAARTTGASRIYMTDLVAARLAAARKLGADAVMNPADGDVAQWIENLTDGRGVDVAFECAGVQETLTHSCLAAAKCGRVVLVGIPSEDDLSIPMHKCRRKELTMLHVRRSNGEIRAAMSLVASGRLDVKPLATHFFPLERLTEAFALVSNYGDGVIRAVIQPNGPTD
jgi:L-iditol 2-dehydrogenase